MSKIMTVKHTKLLVARVRSALPDPEKAHALDDELRAKVLQAIARGQAEDARQMAQIALETEFLLTRWYA